MGVSKVKKRIKASNKEENGKKGRQVTVALAVRAKMSPSRLHLAAIVDMTL